MDQKNTIVKCKAHPNCLFNHNGVCDNYVISIGKDGKCDCYIETKLSEHCNETFLMTMKAATFNAPNENKSIISDYEPFLTKAICSQCKYNTHSNLCSRKNVASNGIWTCWEKKE